RKFNYELAQGNTPGQIAALLKMVSISQVLYGTDFPFRDGAEVNQGIADWGFAAAELRAIEQENAVKLLPRLKAGGFHRRSRGGGAKRGPTFQSRWSWVPAFAGTTSVVIARALPRDRAPFVGELFGAAQRQRKDGVGRVRRPGGREDARPRHVEVG